MTPEKLTERDLPCVMVVKGDERYIFRYTPGNEATLVACLMDYARDENVSLSWIEALMIIRRLGM